MFIKNDNSFIVTHLKTVLCNNSFLKRFLSIFIPEWWRLSVSLNTDRSNVNVAHISSPYLVPLHQNGGHPVNLFFWGGGCFGKKRRPAFAAKERKSVWTCAVWGQELGAVGSDWSSQREKQAGFFWVRGSLSLRVWLPVFFGSEVVCKVQKEPCWKDGVLQGVHGSEAKPYRH